MPQTSTAKPYRKVPITDCGDLLISIPDEIPCFDPHPYQVLGADYGDRSPFMLRSSIVTRLQSAQEHLQSQRPDLSLKIFDALRPIAVQQFMVDYTFTQLCQDRQLDPVNLTPQQHQDCLEEVLTLWAIPSHDAATPPPHSTGAAVDLTLFNLETGEDVDMGSPIDEMSERSHPLHFHSASDGTRYAQNRDILHKAMTTAGFLRHPQEWWHFSYGDQIWAWLSQADKAIYGGVDYL